MSLRPLLRIGNENERLAALRQALRASESTVEAYVSSSLRPYLLAALVDEDGASPNPVLIVSADDRAARDLGET